MLTHLSVVLCSHNPRREYLQRTLQSLRAQSLSTAEWELLLVDNASTPPLSAEYDLSWHPGARHVREEVLGLTAARLRGIREFKGRLLVFVDDDNVLEADYLENAKAIAEAYPQLGAFGAGALEPEFEVEPPAEILPFVPRLALRRAPRVFWGNNPQDSACCPFGAGLCVTRRTTERFVRILRELRTQVILGRRGQQLNSNEDDVFVWAAAQEGLGFGVFPELRICHLIAANRVTKHYILRLLEDSKFSECVLYYLLQRVVPRRPGLSLLARVLYSGLQGRFTLRCRFAEARGEVRAARYIIENGLRPLRDGDSVTSATVADFA